MAYLHHAIHQLRNERRQAKERVEKLDSAISMVGRRQGQMGELYGEEGRLMQVYEPELLARRVI